MDPTTAWEHPGFASSSTNVLAAQDPADGTLKDLVQVDTATGDTVLRAFKNGVIKAVAALQLTAGFGVGAAPFAAWGANFAPATMTGSAQGGIRLVPTFSTATTDTGYGLFVQPVTAAGTYTTGAVRAVHIANPTKGAGNTITTAYGLYIESITAGSTNYAIYTDSGLVRFGGAVTMASTLSVTSGASFSALATAASVRATGTSGLAGAVGAGVEAFYASGFAQVQGYNRTTSAAEPLLLQGSGGVVLVGTTVTTGANAGDLVSAGAYRGLNTASTTTALIQALGSASVQIMPGNGGSVLIGTGVSSGAGVGDVVTGYGAELRGVNSTLNNTIRMVGIEGANRIVLGDAGFDIQIQSASIGSARDISVGAADSGGVGYRLLRVPN